MLPRKQQRGTQVEIGTGCLLNYTFYLADDGEVYARTLIRSGLDIESIFEIMYQGPFIISHILPKLEKIAGKFSNV